MSRYKGYALLLAVCLLLAALTGCELDGDLAEGSLPEAEPAPPASEAPPVVDMPDEDGTASTPPEPLEERADGSGSEGVSDSAGAAGETSSLPDPSAPLSEGSAAEEEPRTPAADDEPDRDADADEAIRRTGPPVGESSEPPVTAHRAAAPAEPIPLPDDSRIPEELLGLINNERAENGLEPLEMESDLQLAAEIRALEALDSLSHTRPGGQPYHTVFDETGFSYAGKWHGENLAVIKADAEDYDQSQVAGALFAHWKDSAGQHQNMLRENFTQTGLGVSIRRDGDALEIGAAQMLAGE